MTVTVNFNGNYNHTAVTTAITCNRECNKLQYLPNMSWHTPYQWFAIVVTVLNPYLYTHPPVHWMLLETFATKIQHCKIKLEPFIYHIQKKIITHTSTLINISDRQKPNRSSNTSPHYTNWCLGIWYMVCSRRTGICHMWHMNILPSCTTTTWTLDDFWCTYVGAKVHWWFYLGCVIIIRDIMSLHMLSFLSICIVSVVSCLQLHHSNNGSHLQ